MAASPVKRYTRVVKTASVTIADKATGTLTLSHPVDVLPTTIPPTPFSGTVGPSTPIPAPQTVVAPRGTLGVNLLAQGGDQISALGGYLSCHVGGTVAAAGGTLRAVQLIDANGNVMDTIWSDSVGLDFSTDATVIGKILTSIPLAGNQSLKLTIYNGLSAGDKTAIGYARFDLGVDVQQPFDNSLAASF